MSGEWQLLEGGEYPHPIIGTGILRFQDELGFAEIGPGRERRHAFIAQLVGSKHHRQRIAFEWYATEDIDLLEIE